MEKSDIFNRLAQVYFSKPGSSARPEKPPREKAVLVLIISLCSLIILLMTFLLRPGIFNTKSVDSFKSISIAKNLTPVKINYDFRTPFYDRNDFSLELPSLDISGFNTLELSVKEQAKAGSLRSLKIVLENLRNETDSIYIKGLKTGWQHYQIPLSEFADLTDRSKLSRISFVLEAWNMDSQQGTVFIDNIRFSNEARTYGTIVPR